MEFEEEDEDALEERRGRIREKNLLRQQEEEEEEEEEAEEAEAVEEEESEYETESEEETTTSRIAIVKPAVFVPKFERDTIHERERREAEERAVEELLRKKLEERKLETKQIVVEKIRDEEILTQKNLELEANIAADVDTDDEVNEAEEYKAWKSRERARIKRKKEEEAILKAVQKEIEMLRNMTEEERNEWERRNPKPSPPPPKKKKRKFMQKYYHKGAFFQSDPDDRARAGTSGIDSIYLRNFSAPIGEDKLDKSMLPKVMQVKHFGRSGRTKWTHLVNEDTTYRNNTRIHNDTILRAKYNMKMACC